MRAQCIYTICIHTFLMPFYHEKLLDGVDCQIAPSKSSIIKWKLQSVRVRLNFAKLWNLGQNAHVHAECMRYACGRKLNVRMWVRATWKSVATHTLLITLASQFWWQSCLGRKNFYNFHNFTTSWMVVWIKSRRAYKSETPFRFHHLLFYKNWLAHFSQRWKSKNPITG